MNFDIKTEQISDDAYVISLAGEVDLYTAPEFKQQLLEVIGQGGKDVIVDFTNTTFIDSTTLGVLVGGVKRLRSNDGQLSLVCSDRNITKIFEITGLDRVFTIHPSRDEAIATIGASTSLDAGCGRGCARRSRACGLGLRLRRGPRRVRSADKSHGKQLFMEKCGCLPHARRGERERQGRAEPRRRRSGRTTTRASRSRRSARSSPTRSSSPGNYGDKGPTMPRNLVTGRRRRRRRRVRRGRRRAAQGRVDHGRPERRRPPADHDDDHHAFRRRRRRRRRRGGRQEAFNANGCGACHTLAAAGTNGTVGPDLDKLKSYAPAANMPLEDFIHESIVDPNDVRREGLPEGRHAGLLESLPKSTLDALVAFLAQSAK